MNPRYIPVEALRATLKVIVKHKNQGLEVDPVMLAVISAPRQQATHRQTNSDIRKGMQT